MTKSMLGENDTKQRPKKRVKCVGRGAREREGKGGGTDVYIIHVRIMEGVFPLFHLLLSLPPSPSLF